MQRTKQLIDTGKLASFVINRSFAFSGVVLRRSSRQQREKARIYSVGHDSKRLWKKPSRCFINKGRSLAFVTACISNQRKSGLGFPSILTFQWEFLLFTFSWIFECFPWGMQHNFHIRGKGTGDTECPVPSAALPSLWLSLQPSLHLEAADWRRRQPDIWRPGTLCLECQTPHWDLLASSY